MRTVEQLRTGSSVAGTRGVDVAGTVWPLFKLEAIAVAAVVFLLTLLIVSSLQVAVLGGAAAGTVVWVAGLARQATRRHR
ncbi:MAG TPA: hypothetical protein VIW24_07180 [Aldersonia sp.]